MHHDNASPHTADDTIKFLEKSNIRSIVHPPYSPDLAPCDFFLFPYLKDRLRGKTHRNIPELQAAVEKVLHSIPKETLVHTFEDWAVRWRKCVLAGGNYFEGQRIGNNIRVETFDPEESSEDSSENED